MKSYLIQTDSENLASELNNWKDKKIDLAIMFSSRGIIEENSFLGDIKSALPDAEFMGCSTSGEIGETIEDDSISLLGMSFDSSKFKCATIEIRSMDDSRAAGNELAKKLHGDKLKGIFVLLPGVNVNGSKFTLGLKDALPKDVSISGGLAGDGLNFQATKTIHNGEVFDNFAVGVGFYGDDIEILSDARGGWEPFGPQRRVTKVENNILYELDGKSALGLYKEYLGEKAKDLPSSGLLYPFAIMEDDNADTVGLIRTILDIDEERGCLVLAGDMEVGQKVCLMHANTDQLVEGAQNAAINLGEIDEESGALICVSCVGRKILMGDDTEEELEVIREKLGDKLPITGFYSYGEICYFEGTKQTELHNQTMTLTFIREKAA